MSEQVDLNRLRDLVNGNARAGDPRPSAEDERIYVEPGGSLVLGSEINGERAKLSEVHQGVFAAGLSPRREAPVNVDKLPPGARYINQKNARGWMYEITNDFGDAYVFFVYRDKGGLYRSMMVSPEVDQPVDVHLGHIFESGDLCLAPEVGLPSVEQTFAKTVLFSVGWSTYVRTGEFPFAGARS